MYASSIQMSSTGWQNVESNRTSMGSAELVCSIGFVFMWQWRQRTVEFSSSRRKSHAQKLGAKNQNARWSEAISPVVGESCLLAPEAKMMISGRFQWPLQARRTYNFFGESVA